MAAANLFITLAMAATIIPSILAKDYMVGDAAGWTTNFDYQAWAKGKDFRVGDRLIFKYPEGAHSVIRVDGVAFQQCVKPSNVEALASGSDVIPLATPGKKWYFCGVAKHCESANQKLAITVLAADDGQGDSLMSPAASPSDQQSAAATTNTGSVLFYGAMLACVLTLLLV